MKWDTFGKLLSIMNNDEIKLPVCCVSSDSEEILYILVNPPFRRISVRGSDNSRLSIMSIIRSYIPYPIEIKIAANMYSIIVAWNGF